MFIPLVIAGGILGILGILLWLGARERRQISVMRDDDLGDLKVFKAHWETVFPKLFGQELIPVAGLGKSAGPTSSQRSTLDFVQQNMSELFASAISAAKGELAAAPVVSEPNDLRVSQIFLHKDVNSFELSVDSESCSTTIPDGVAVSFNGREIYATEFVH